MTQLALIIDLDECVGCGACVSSCQEQNFSENYTNDKNANKTGLALTQIQTYELGNYQNSRTLHFPKTCFHCESPPCVPVCPTGASYKRESDGIVLVDEEKCIGCSYCAWACPYGVRLMDPTSGTMKKCTLCVDRIYDESLPEELRIPACVLVCPTSARLFGDIHDYSDPVSLAIHEAEGYQIMPDLGCSPSGRYLRKK